MKIAYSCNDYYIPQTGISMTSLFECNKECPEIIIYFIGKDVSSINVDKLKSIANKYHRQFVFINFDEIAYDLEISAIGRHIETIYAKIFFPRIDCLDKVIYLDSDTIINGSLLPLWNTDISDVYMGVVQSDTEKRKALGLDKDVPVFNDGMALINVDYCRKNNLIGKAKEQIAIFKGNPPILSEGILNVICQKKVKYLSLKWNCMAGMLYLGKISTKYLSSILTEYSVDDLDNSCNNPVVIHYLSAFYNRPWFEPCTHPYKHIYYKYKEMTIWKDIKPIHKKLPIKIRMIDWSYKKLGVQMTWFMRRCFRFFIN